MTHTPRIVFKALYHIMLIYFSRIHFMFGVIIFGIVSLALTLIGFLVGIGADKASYMFGGEGFMSFWNSIGLNKGTESRILTIALMVIGGLFLVTIFLSLVRRDCKLNIVKGAISAIVCIFSIYIYASAPAPIPGWSGIVVLIGAAVGLVGFYFANWKVD